MKENKNILQEFDEIMERRKRMPVLMNIFEQFSDEIYGESKVQKKAVDEKDKLQKEMKLNFEQNKLFEQYDELENLILDNMVESAFIYGFAISEELKDEVRRNIVQNHENDAGEKRNQKMINYIDC